MYPVMLSLQGKRCLVVGGGPVALRKAEGLLCEGAKVTVVATELDPALAALAAKGALAVERRPYAPPEAGKGYVLVIAATSDRTVNAQVSQDAAARGVFVNVADDPLLCSFHLPARLRRGALEIAVASNGLAPFAARRVRDLLARRLGPAWTDWSSRATRLRELVRERQLRGPAADQVYDRFFAASLDPDRLAPRPAQPLEDLLDDPEVPPRTGLVSLVGAGPGDPGLLTLRARRRLLAADAVVYDRLAEPALPCDLNPDVELHDVGKQPGRHPVPQEEISALLVRLAREGKRVVRLKGGDPFVFGRGGEEAEALRAADIPYEVVPGVTAGVSAPAYAGIPVTHRRMALRVSLVTAHEASAEGEAEKLCWQHLADGCGTLVGYMGVGALKRVAERLVAAGLSPTTPAALIQQGTTSRQRVVRATLAGLPEAGRAAGVTPPALVVVGPTVELAERLEWVTRRPLQGKRLLLPPSAAGFADALDMAGAELLEAPLPLNRGARIAIQTAPLDGVLLHASEEADALEPDRGLFAPGAVAWCLSVDAAGRSRALGWTVRDLSGRDAIAGILKELV